MQLTQWLASLFLLSVYICSSDDFICKIDVSCPVKTEICTVLSFSLKLRSIHLKIPFSDISDLHNLRNPILRFSSTILCKALVVIILLLVQIVEVVCCKLTALQSDLYNHFIHSKNVNYLIHIFLVVSGTKLNSLLDYDKVELLFATTKYRSKEQLLRKQRRLKS